MVRKTVMEVRLGKQKMVFTLSIIEKERNKWLIIIRKIGKDDKISTCAVRIKPLLYIFER